MAIRFSGRYGKDPADAVEKPLDLRAVVVRHGIPQGGENRLRILGNSLLHAPPLGREKDAAHTAITRMGLTANETPLLQAPEDRRHGVRVRAGPFHDCDLSDTGLACHDGEKHELVGGHAVVEHPGIGTAME